MVCSDKADIMKAPDTIELETCTFSDIGYFDIDGGDEGFVYVRRDAIIDWLLHVKQYDQEIHIQTVIDKINSL